MKFTALFGTALLAQSMLASASIFDKRSAESDAAIRARHASGKVATLVPVDEYHPRLGRRSEKEKLDPENLSLQENVFLQWATMNEEGSIYRATMNITSDDGTKLLFMNKFQDFTTAVDCSTRDGDGLSITFKKQEYLNLAKKHWDWLTGDAGRVFWIITNHRDCAKDDDPIDEFVPYKISDVDYVGLTAEFVKSERRTMEQALEYFNFEFAWGQHGEQPPVSQAALQRRWNPFEDIKDGFEDIADWFSKGWDDVKDTFGDAADKVKEFVNDAGSFDKGETWEFSLEHGTPEEKTKLSPDILGENELWCIDCYSKGKFIIEGKAVMEKLKLVEASYSVKPQDVSMRLKMNAKLAQADWELYKLQVWSLPFAAIEIPYLFHFGPEFRIDAEFGKAINSEVDFNFGFEASLPNDAYVKNNMVDGQDTEKANWEKGTANALDFELNGGVVDIDLSFAVIPVLSFGYEILGMGGYEAALKAPLPRWTGNFTTIEKEEGACENISDNPEASKLGIQIDQTIEAGLSFYIGENVFATDGSSKPFVDVELFKWSHEIEPSCKPIVDKRAEEEQKLIEEDPELKALDEESKKLDEELAALEAELAALENGEDVPEDETDVSDGDFPASSGVVPTGVYPTGTGMPGPTGTGNASPFYNTTDTYVVPQVAPQYAYADSA